MLNRISTLLTTAKQRNTTVARALCEANSWMSPGWYVVNGNIAWRIPGTGIKDAIHLYQGIVRSSVYGHLEKIIRSIDFVTPPNIIKIPNSEESGTAEYLMIPLSHGNFKIFDRDSKKVITHYKPNSYRQLRYSYDLLKDVYPVVPLKFIKKNQKCLVKEPLITGPNFNNLNPHLKTKVLYSLIEASAMSTQDSENKQWPREQVSSLMTALSTDKTPKKWSDRVTSINTKIECAIANMSLAPSHLDLHGKNILYNHNYNSWHVIDLMTADWHPWYFDFLRLLLGEYIKTDQRLIHNIEPTRFRTVCHQRDEFTSKRSAKLHFLIFLMCHMRRPHPPIKDWDAIESLYQDIIKISSTT